MTLTIGWWVVPLLFTLIAFAFSFWYSREYGGGLFGAIVYLGNLMMAAILSLIGWVIYFAVT
jgi:lipopolysaccharide export LptBFGC system permease protein LptF